eukprot:TRINITY_DN29746_c0_g1_i2.p1 TRINITY_DN29746_c0_g1~~TRINITY_DN29746_c0_g1_i2.p1  ORF type:complete len:112 (+),score=25.13 TRINITY_DN29746_c0_g1_i2:187-522(+)
MQKSGVRPNARTYAALAASKERAGEWEEVEAIFSEMDTARIERDVRTHAMMLSAYANAKPPCKDLAEALLESLPAALKRDALIGAALKRVRTRTKAEENLKSRPEKRVLGY